MSEGLLPCPHCGGEAITPTNWGDPSRPIPRCRDCRAEAPSPEAWNRRTPGPDVSRLLADLAAARAEAEAWRASSNRMWEEKLTILDQRDGIEAQLADLAGRVRGEAPAMSRMYPLPIDGPRGHHPGRATEAAARTPGPDVSRLLEACRVALGALMNGSTDTQRHAAFHHLRGAMKAAEQEAAQPE